MHRCACGIDVIDEQERFLKKLNKENNINKQEVKESDSSFEHNQDDIEEPNHLAPYIDKSSEIQNNPSNKFVSFRNLNDNQQDKNSKLSKLTHNSSHELQKGSNSSGNSKSEFVSLQFKHSLNSVNSERDDEKMADDSDSDFEFRDKIDCDKIQTNLIVEILTIFLIRIKIK